MTETTSGIIGASQAVAPPLPLERFAELAAEVDAGVAERDVLLRAELAEEAWSQAKVFWLRRMADEAERKRFELTTRYQAVFKARRAVFDAKLRRERDRAARVKVEAPTSPALDAASRELATPLVSQLLPLRLPDPPPTTSPLPHRPPPMAPPGVAPLPMPPARMPSAPPMPSPPMAAAPLAPSPPAPIHSPGPVMPAFVAKKQKFATMMADARDFQPATPFGPAGAAKKAPPLGVALPKQDLGSTVTADDAPRTQPLPFAGAGAAGAPPALAPNKSAKAGATMMADASQFVAPALPFAGDPAAPKKYPSSAPPPDFAKRGGDTSSLGKPPSSTVALDADALHAAIAAMPFRDPPGEGHGAPSTSPPPAPAASPPNGAKRLSINVFASLTAEIAEGANADEARKRYGLSEAEHHEESLRWTEEFARNDEIRARYFGIVQRYRTYLQTRK